MQRLKDISSVIFLIFIVYMAIANIVFQFRNPTSNELSVFRNFSDVVTWQKLPEYQIKD